jgi:peptidoglycan/LPS O-acetylase OafA/YrhL
MENVITSGLIVFVITTCCWFIAVMYYALRSWKSVLCYTVLPVLGICATGLTFAGIGVQHTFPPLFLAVPLLGAGIGVYVGYRIDQKFG